MTQHLSVPASLGYSGTVGPSVIRTTVVGNPTLV